MEGTPRGWGTPGPPAARAHFPRRCIQLIVNKTSRRAAVTVARPKPSELETRTLQSPILPVPLHCALWMCAAPLARAPAGSRPRGSGSLQVWPHWQVAQAASPQLPEWEVAGTANLSKTGRRAFTFNISSWCSHCGRPPNLKSESASPRTIESHRVSASVQQAPSPKRRGFQGPQVRSGQVRSGQVRSGQVRSGPEGQVYYSAKV